MDSTRPRLDLCSRRLIAGLWRLNKARLQLTKLQRPTRVRSVLTEGRTGWDRGRARMPSGGPGGPVLPLPGVSGRATALCWSVPAPPQQQDSGLLHTVIMRNLDVYSSTRLPM